MTLAEEVVLSRRRQRCLACGEEIVPLDMILGHYGATEEMGRVGAFLLSPAASYVTGAIVPVDGGMIRALP